jgi:3-dehydroquinate dehydratase II
MAEWRQSNYQGPAGAVSALVVEAHILNRHAREDFRHQSMIAPATAGMIRGFGPHSYFPALHALTTITQ